MKITINIYAGSLTSTWTCSLGDQLTQARTLVIRKFELIVKDYYNQVYSNDNRNKPKHSKDVVQHSSIRMLNRVWRNSLISYTDTD